MVALAKFDMLGDHRHRAIGGNLDEGSKGAEVFLGPNRENVAGSAADQQGTAHEGRADHEFTPCRAGFQIVRNDRCVHDLVPQTLAAAGIPAASLIAARMR